MSVLVTGAAGFIGSHVARALLARGEQVVGIDNFSDYYDPVLKFARLKPLREDKGFTFLEADISDREAMLALADRHRDIDRIVHLAAQPGVRHSLVDPYVYVQTNVMGHLVMLELARRLPGLKHFVYASSSSVYGGNRKLPFAIGRPGRSSGVALCRDQARRRADDRDLRPPVQAQGDRPALFHGLRPVGPARHVAVHLRQGDPRGHAPSSSITWAS